MVNFRKAERFIPTCPACQGDMLDAEDYVPTHAAPWSGPEDPDPDELYCPNCDPRPIPYVLTPAPTMVIRPSARDELNAEIDRLLESGWAGSAPAEDRSETSGVVRHRPVRRLARDLYGWISGSGGRS
jgi:hypothetical protein